MTTVNDSTHQPDGVAPSQEFLVAVESWAMDLVDTSGRNPLLRLPDNGMFIDLSGADTTVLARLTAGQVVSANDLLVTADPEVHQSLGSIGMRSDEHFMGRGIRSSSIGLGLAT